jgi:16S rRNA (guanine527-N7)-methyltransferase
LSARLAELAAALAAPDAPSTVRDVWADHIEDARAGLEAVGTPGSIADLGSGNGIPGLVLADALPQAHVFCVEAARKRADWIRVTAARCGLENVSAVWARAEEWDGRADVVVARALASLNVLCEYAAPLLAEGGRAIFWKGGVSAEEEADGRHAASVLGLSEPSVTAVPGTRRRSLWVFHRARPVPPGYPRRAGMAVKRPLVRVRNDQ